MKIELIVIGFQREEEIENRFQRFFRLRVGTVDSMLLLVPDYAARSVAAP